MREVSEEARVVGVAVEAWSVSVQAREYVRV